MCAEYPLNQLSFTQMSLLLGSLVWASGFIPLGSLHLRPLQQQFSFLGLTAGLHHSVDQTYLLRHLQGLFSLLESLSDLSRQSSQPLQMPIHSAGTAIWRIPRFWVRKLYIFCLELKVALHDWVTGPDTFLAV